MRLAFNTVVRAERPALGDQPPRATPKRQICAETMAQLTGNDRSGLLRAEAPYR